MRDSTVLSMAAPPEWQDLWIPGCEAAQSSNGCAWETARLLLQKAVDPAAVATN